jgi:UDP-glucose 4-epimerase
MIEISEAIEVIENCLKVSGYNVIPNLKSFLVKDLFEIYETRFGLKYTVGRPRISEKIHEIMIAKEEIPRTNYNVKDNCFYMHYENLADTNVEIEEFSSKETVVSKKELGEMLKKYDFFKPE